MILQEKKLNLLELDAKYYLVHCISADYKMDTIISEKLDKKFNLKSQFRSIEESGTYIKKGTSWIIGKTINLITKSKYYEKTTYETIELTFSDMKETCQLENIKHLAIPLIVFKLEGLSLNMVRELINNTFRDTEFEILIGPL
ncbi:hypothetical protein [Clostridium sp. C8-1-8]|uniref:hypothetical protein n=1 Tax=Clostridium sp. C8-1-8 TaxID=2698831 RepID=UPI00137075AD|nr:hypothetical protein [Clostridium sp. C8-1-8]